MSWALIFVVNGYLVVVYHKAVSWALMFVVNGYLAVIYHKAVFGPDVCCKWLSSCGYTTRLCLGP